MPELQNRDKFEKEIEDLLWGVWMDWSNTPSVEDLNRFDLHEMVQARLRDPVETAWRSGYETVLTQFNGLSRPNTEAAFFLLFYSDLARSITDRWMMRIENYKLDQRTPKPYRPKWEHARGAGEAVRRRVPGLPSKPDGTMDLPDEYGPTGVVETVNGTNYRQFFDPEAMQLLWVASVLFPGSDRKVMGAKPVVYSTDAETEGINWTTGANTFGESFAVRQVTSQGAGPIVGVWATERDGRVCSRCSPLDGMPPRIWRPVAPSGPPLHARCRCEIYWRQAITSDRYSSSPFGANSRELNRT